VRKRDIVAQVAWHLAPWVESVALRLTRAVPARNVWRVQEWTRRARSLRRCYAARLVAARPALPLKGRTATLFAFRLHLEVEHDLGYQIGEL
jgi:hypothetical protein